MKIILNHQTFARELSTIFCVVEQGAQFSLCYKKTLLCGCVLIRRRGQTASAAQRSPDADKTIGCVDTY